MKTPEQIARETLAKHWESVDPYGVWEESRGDALRACVVAAIEADRKQRNPGSASEREELARGILDSAPGPDRERALASVVRLFLSRPEVNESVEQIALRIVEGSKGDLVVDAVRAGMDAAFESWEPDDYAEPESVVAALRRALIDRGNVAAGNWVTLHEQQIWDSMIGPMLDRMEVAAKLSSTLWDPSGTPLPDAAAETASFDLDVEQAIRSEARSAINARGPREFDEHDPRL